MSVPADRRMPIPLPDGGLVVPGALAAELAAALGLLADYERGVTRPAACSAPRLTSALAALRAAAREAAITHRAEQTRQATWAPKPPVLGPAQTVPVSEPQMITTTDAARLANVTPERIRQLAAGGRVQATRGARGSWLVNADQVRAYAAERRTT